MGLKTQVSYYVPAIHDPFVCNVTTCIEYLYQHRGHRQQEYQQQCTDNRQQCTNNRDNSVPATDNSVPTTETTVYRQQTRVYQQQRQQCINNRDNSVSTTDNRVSTTETTVYQQQTTMYRQQRQQCTSNRQQCINNRDNSVPTTDNSVPTTDNSVSTTEYQQQTTVYQQQTTVYQQQRQQCTGNVSITTNYKLHLSKCGCYLPPLINTFKCFSLYLMKHDFNYVIHRQINSVENRFVNSPHRITTWQNTWWIFPHVFVLTSTYCSIHTCVLKSQSFAILALFYKLLFNNPVKLQLKVWWLSWHRMETWSNFIIYTVTTRLYNLLKKYVESFIQLISSFLLFMIWSFISSKVCDVQWSVAVAH